MHSAVFWPADGPPIEPPPAGLPPEALVFGGNCLQKQTSRITPRDEKSRDGGPRLVNYEWQV